MKTTLKIICLCIASLTASATLAEEEVLATFKTMKPALALDLAQATLKACRADGFQVAVAVVDRAGVAQVILRDQLAGAHTPETARRKAWTAASFRTDTLTLMEETQAGKLQSGVRFVSEAMMIGGGIPVTTAGTLVGALSVDRAADTCGSKSCWKAGKAGFTYKDKEAASSGVKKISTKAGDSGKGKVKVQAGNKAKKNQTELPAGLTAALEGRPSATVQVVASGASCTGATLTTVKKADATQFKAKTP